MKELRCLLIVVVLLGLLLPQAAAQTNFRTRDILNLRLQAQSTPDMTCYVPAGWGYVGSVPVIFVGGNTPAFVAPGSNNRIDLVTLDASGTLAITQGVAAASPTRPDCPDDVTPVGTVYLRSTTTSIYPYNDTAAAHGYILDDCRPLVSGIPQDIRTSASPTFVGLTLSGLTATRVLYAGVGGVVSDDAGFTYDDADNAATLGGYLNVGAGGYASAVGGIGANHLGVGVAEDATYLISTDGPYALQMSRVGSTDTWGAILSTGKGGMLVFKNLTDADNVLALSEDAPQIGGADGSAAAPTWSWMDDWDTGFMRSAADTMVAVTNGTARWQFQADGDFVPAGDNAYDIGGAAWGVKALYLSDANTTNPSTEGELRWDADTATPNTYDGGEVISHGGLIASDYTTDTNTYSAGGGTDYHPAYTVSNDALTVGKVVHIRIWGNCTCGGPGAVGTFAYYLAGGGAAGSPGDESLGGFSLASDGVSGNQNGDWEFDVTMIVAASGSSNTLVIQSHFLSVDPNSTAFSKTARKAPDLGQHHVNEAYDVDTTTDMRVQVRGVLAGTPAGSSRQLGAVITIEDS